MLLGNFSVNNMQSTTSVAKQMVLLCEFLSHFQKVLVLKRTLTGSGAVTRRDSCIDFGAIKILFVCLLNFVPSSLSSFLNSFFPYAFFLIYLLPYSFTS